METSNVQPGYPFEPTGTNTMAAQDMTTDMDIDMDIDLTGDPELEALEAEAMRMDDQSANAANGAIDQGPDQAEPQHEKVHIRGLDNLTTGEIKAYALECYPSDQYVKIEWIDDTSANIVYETAEAARDALNALTDPAVGDVSTVAPFQLRRAKRLFDKPEVELGVRQAVVGDVKKPRAHEASRFYLMNPDKDPRERKRQPEPRRGAGYNRRRYDDREQKRRRDQDSFDVDMYDGEGGEDGEVARSRNGGGRGRRDSRSDGSEDGRRNGRKSTFRARSGSDLFATSKSDGRLRDRSASPLRDGDGRYGFEENENAARRKVRRRSYTPPPVYRSRNPNPHPVVNVGKELFPEQAPKSALRPSSSNGTSSSTTKELFPHKHTPGKRSRELFPHKTSVSNHRRQDAFDAADGTETFIGNKSRSLEERITGGPGSSNGSSRAAAHHSRPAQDPGFSVKGSAQAPGFAIRGAASEVVKELFPMKSGSNAGKELFVEKIKGRGGPRRKAEDMFF